MSLLLGTAEQRYITPVHRPYPGYLVQLPAPGATNKIVKKIFAGNQKPLDHYLGLAVAWRDVTYASLHGTPLPERQFHGNSRPGKELIPGVRRLIKKVRKTTKAGDVRVTLVPCIIAEIHTVVGHDYKRPRKSKSRIFSIKKYGEAEAILLASICRKQMEQALELSAKMQKRAEGQCPQPSCSGASIPADNCGTTGASPATLIDVLIAHLGLHSQRQLATRLGVQPEVISKIRNNRLPLRASVLLRMHEVSDISIAQLRLLAGATGLTCHGSSHP